MVNEDPYYGILMKPILSEKSNKLQEIRNQFTFKVRKTANKSEVKKAIETLFNVKVEAVNMINQVGKDKKVHGRPGRTPDWKKALVKLQEGQSIDII